MLSRILVFILIVAGLFVFGFEFTAENYPNPKTPQGAKECNMRSISNVCDPDQVLSESDRYRFNDELQQMVRRTEKIVGNFCDKKGFEPLLLIAHEGSQELADKINLLWNLDGHCKKSVIFFLSALDHAFYYSSEPGTGFDQSDFFAVKLGQNHYLAEGNFTFALTNIFKQIGGARNIQVTSNDKEKNYKIHKNEHNSASSLFFIPIFILYFF